MDTATHFAFGFGLAGLAQLDPIVAGDPWTSAAVMIGTVAGSQAPDADTLLKFRGNAIYVRNHRGISHSIPAWFFWTGLISVLLWLIFPGVPYHTFALWVFIAVVLHVATDLFNSYGTQAFRPFTSKWIAWDSIHIFDPLLFTAHGVALFLWIFDLGSPTVLFPILYGLVAAYFAIRSVQHDRLLRRLPKVDPDYSPGDTYAAIPTVSMWTYNLIKTKKNGNYVIGTWHAGRSIWNEELVCESAPEIDASRSQPDVAAFLSFSSYPCAQLEKTSTETTIRWVDARYYHRKQFPFLAVVKYNKDMTPVFSYVGWISTEKLKQRIYQPLRVSPKRR